jgi:hypothetical protein
MIIIITRQGDEIVAQGTAQQTEQLRPTIESTHGLVAMQLVRPAIKHRFREKA